MKIFDRFKINASVWCNGWGMNLMFRTYCVSENRENVTGFRIWRNNTCWRWVTLSFTGSGLVYSEGKRGKEVCGWFLRGPFEFTTRGEGIFP